jgi:hypothetical protein
MARQAKLRFMNNAGAFQAPLHVLDTEKQTFGCRYSNPDFCSKNRLPQVCAFASNDNICLAPPKLWPKQFRKLLAEGKCQIQPTQDPAPPVLAAGSGH